MDSNHRKLPATMMPTLPVDVIIDILCRLPVKTLIRFRCVSKQFHTIIDDPDFVKRHLQFHSFDRRLIVRGADPEFLFLDLNLVDNAFCLETPYEGWGRVIVIGSCDGLLALLNTSIDIICLWNVSTKKHHFLPPCPGVDCFPNPYHNYGFGRDSATDDYKLVKISFFYKYDVTQVNVYSLNANCWRRFDGSPLYSRYYFPAVSVISALVEGTLNWLVKVEEDEDNREDLMVELEEDEDDIKDLIVSFDLKNEFFFELSLPDTIKRSLEYRLTLMVLGGCLSVISSYRCEHVYEIWVMKEYSWTKLYSFSHDNPPIIRHPYPRVFLCSMHEDNFLIREGCGEVFRCDMEEKKFEILKINKLQKCITSVSTYVESLISPYGKHSYMQKRK